ncbi:hypothetical protein ACVW1B_004479 [Bradyrhizobium sp. USDA 4502]
MTTRRDFLKAGANAAAGIVFCGCGLVHNANAQQSRQQLPVTVNGKRVKTIDIHAHCHFREAGALLGADAGKYQLPPVNGAAEAFIEIDKRLAAMDAQAIDMEVLSINPFWYDRDRDLAGKIVKIQNEKLAELCASKPDRFAAFASLTLQAPDLAVQELETAVKKQGLKGAAIGGVVDGAEFSNPKFHPVWAKAEELGVPLFIHPQGVPELNKRLSGNGWLGNTIGNPLETTIALSHLIFEGTLDRFPGTENHRRTWRRLSRLVRRPLGPCLSGWTQGMQSGDQAPEGAGGVSQADLFRLSDLHAGGDQAPRRPGWRRPDRAGKRLSLSMATGSGRPHLRLVVAKRR